MEYITKAVVSVCAILIAYKTLIVLTLLLFFAIFAVAVVLLREFDRSTYKKRKETNPDESTKEVKEKTHLKIKNFFSGIIGLIFTTILIIIVILFLFGGFTWVYEKVTFQEEKPLSKKEQILLDKDFAFAKPYLEKCVDGCKIATSITIKAGDITEERLLGYPSFQYADYIVDQDVDIIFKDGGGTSVNRDFPRDNSDLCGKKISRTRRVTNGAIFARSVDRTKDVHIVVLTFPLGHYLCVN